MKKEDFIFKVEGKFSRAIGRQCHEGLAISHALDAIKQGDRVILMNSKNEFLQPGVVHRTFTGVLATSNAAEPGLRSSRESFGAQSSNISNREGFIQQS